MDIPGEGRNRPLVLLKLTFARLIDDIVVLYDKDESLFIDGVPLTRSKLRRIKIIGLGEAFEVGMRQLDRGLRHGEIKSGDQYEMRFEHILRTDAEDVTAQVIKAYNQAVKPRLSDYLPNRHEVISAATAIFVEAEVPKQVTSGGSPNWRLQTDATSKVVPESRG